MNQNSVRDFVEVYIVLRLEIGLSRRRMRKHTVLRHLVIAVNLSASLAPQM
jgi:hypothetical protein